MRPREVFLSHATADKELAQSVIRELESCGVTVWFAPYRLLGSQKWHDEIGKALRRCDWFVLLLSRVSVQSKWVKNELLYVLNEPRLDERIVPVLMEDCDLEKLSWTLGAIQRVDMRPGFEHGVSELLRVWGIPNQKPERKRKQRRRK